REYDEVVVCFDEKPNLQALERRVGTVPMRARRIERQEFEYVRHGVVNFASALIVHDGSMRGWCLERNDSEHLVPTLDELFEELGQMLRIHLIWDGGPSHTSEMTARCLRRRTRPGSTRPSCCCGRSPSSTSSAATGRAEPIW